MPEDENEDIEVEPIDSDVGDGGDVDPDEVKLAVRQVLVRDEARIMSAVSVALIAVGVVFSVGWLFFAWRVEQNAPSSVIDGSGSASEADIVDRIIALVQISGVLIVPLLLVAAGCGLRLYASRVFTTPDA